MLIDQFFSDNHTDFRIFQECDIKGYTYWVESLSSSGFYNITDGFSSYDEALNFTKQK